MGVTMKKRITPNQRYAANHYSVTPTPSTIIS